MEKNRNLSKLFIIFFGVMSCVMAGSAFGADDHNNRLIRGAWGFSASGSFNMSSPPSVVPAVLSGVIIFDARDECNFWTWTNVGGQTSSEDSVACSYHVNSSGTRGEIDVQLAPSLLSTKIGFVIVNDYYEIRFITLDQDLVIEGVAKRQ
jgi:hypothetical protein